MAFGTLVEIGERKVRPKALPLSELLPRARLVEVSGQHACARTTTAVSCVIQAQARGELVAWVGTRGRVARALGRFRVDRRRSHRRIAAWLFIQLARAASGSFASV
jgi:RecA/RadA recombinase